MRRLPLAGLDESDARPGASERVKPRDHAALTRRLVAETAGNPFLVTEMLRTPLDARMRRSRSASRSWSSGGLLPGDTAIDLLRAAAVAGASFELDLVAAAAGLDEVATLDALDAAGVGVGHRGDRRALPVPPRHRAPDPRRPVERCPAPCPARPAGGGHRVPAGGPPPRLYGHPGASHIVGGRPRGDRRAVRCPVPPPPRRPSAGRWSRPSGWNARRSRTPADDGSQRAEVLTDLAMALLAAGDPGGEPTLIEAAAVARRHGRFDLLARSHWRWRSAVGNARSPDRCRCPRGGDPRVVPARRRGRPPGPGAVAGPRGALRSRGLRPADEALDVMRRRLDALGGPDRLDERIALANDLAVLADAAGDAASAVVAAHERAMAATLAGDDETAQACLRVIEEAAAKTDDRVAAALVAEHEAAKAAMTGHFDDALVAVEAAVRAHSLIDGPEAAAVVARRHRTVLAWMLGARAALPADPGPAEGADAAADAALEHLVRRCRPRPARRPRSGRRRPATAPGDELHALGVLALVAADLRDAALVDPVRACWRRTPT